MHKLTTSLATEYGIVVVEQLNMAGMLRNRRLARVLADAGLAELRRQLGYKTTWYGSRLVVADRFYPSSKTCSTCGWVKAKLTLAERTYTCEACGLQIDRDLNAARNLAKLAQHVAQSGRETQKRSWSGRKTWSIRGRPRRSEKPALGYFPEKTGTVGARAPATRTSAHVEVPVTEPPPCTQAASTALAPQAEPRATRAGAVA
jgi:putative transposase